ncbi:hypothetical protein RRG08_030185 [Elysia crispata]|uniref:Uncharacterized protein n=1 Tax=Elysia crispata TaxID=231223 RepID=A0AAE1DLS1_9GAST|nr:hypothetical protein RRG08_030185 [Elysia crispata]
MTACFENATNSIYNTQPTRSTPKEENCFIPETIILQLSGPLQNYASEVCNPRPDGAQASFQPQMSPVGLHEVFQNRKWQEINGKKQRYHFEIFFLALFKSRFSIANIHGA